MTAPRIRPGDVAVLLLALVDMRSIFELRPRVSAAAVLVLDALREMPGHARYDLAGAVRLTWLLSYEVAHSDIVTAQHGRLLTDAEALVAAVGARVASLRAAA